MPGRHQRQTDRRMQESGIYRMKERKLKELLEQPKLRFIIVSMILFESRLVGQRKFQLYAQTHVHTYTHTLSRILKKKILDIGTGLHR